jgi:hypothetical protein
MSGGLHARGAAALHADFSLPEVSYTEGNAKIKDIHEKNPIDIIETSELGLAFINKIEGVKYIIRLHGGHHFFAEAESRGINKWKFRS